MSASDANSAIYMTDTANQIKNKVNKHGFSGGQETEEEHRRLGGDPDVDVAYQYLGFLEDDDEKYAQIAVVMIVYGSHLINVIQISLLQEYRAGRLLTGELKSLCIGKLQEFVKSFQEVGSMICTFSLRFPYLFSNHRTRLKLRMKFCRISWTPHERLTPLLAIWPKHRLLHDVA